METKKSDLVRVMQLEGHITPRGEVQAIKHYIGPAVNPCHWTKLAFSLVKISTVTEATDTPAGTYLYWKQFPTADQMDDYCSRGKWGL